MDIQALPKRKLGFGNGAKGECIDRLVAYCDEHVSKQSIQYIEPDTFISGQLMLQTAISLCVKLRNVGVRRQPAEQRARSAPRSKH